MSGTISNYTNVFGETASVHDLEHIFDILNETNDDRIIARDFNQIVANIGLKFEAKELKEAYAHIASSVDKKSRVITKESWTKGIDVAHEKANTQKIYKYILSGGQYNPQKKRKEIAYSDIKKALADTKKSPWKHRIECMESLCRQLTTKKMKTDKFHEKFREHHIPLIKQAKDRRSNVMRVACEALSKIIRRWQNVYQRYAYSTITYIYELVRVKIFVVHITGFSLLSTLLQNCTDHKEFKMMHLLGNEAIDSKFENLKKDCFDLLFVYFESTKNEKHKKNDAFYSSLMQYVEKGIDAADEIRNSTMKLLAAIESEKPKVTKPVIKKMNVHLKKRYDEEYKMKAKKKKKTKKISPDSQWEQNGEEKKEEPVKKKEKKSSKNKKEEDAEKKVNKKEDKEKTVDKKKDDKEEPVKKKKKKSNKNKKEEDAEKKVNKKEATKDDKEKKVNKKKKKEANKDDTENGEKKKEEPVKKKKTKANKNKKEEDIEKKVNKKEATKDGKEKKVNKNKKKEAKKEDKEKTVDKKKDDKEEAAKKKETKKEDKEKKSTDEETQESKEEEEDTDITGIEREKMYQDLMKLNIKLLKKKCRHHKVSSEGTKTPMIDRILDKEFSAKQETND